MEGKLTPEELESLRRSDFQAWRRHQDTEAQKQTDTGDAFLGAVGHMTQEVVRDLPKDPSPPSR